MEKNNMILNMGESRIVLNQGDTVDTVIVRGPVLSNTNPWYDEGDYVCPSNFKKAFDKCGDNVRVEINSQGGDVYAGIEIHNMIKNSKKNVEAVVTGRAFSAGTIIMNGANKRTVMDNSQILVHRAMTIAWGNCDEFLAVAEDLERVDSIIRKIYMKSYNGTEEELISLMGENRTINADEALELGLVDAVIESYEDDSNETSAENSFNMNHLNGTELTNEDVEKFILEWRAKNPQQEETKTKNLFKKLGGKI